MLDIKDLKVKTFEGLAVKNYKTFPSREWGDNGGMQADMYLNDKKIGQIFDAGDGGMGTMSFENDADIKGFKTVCFKFLRRLDKDYRNSKLAPKKADELNEDDYVMAVDLIACYCTGKARVI